MPVLHGKNGSVYKRTGTATGEKIVNTTSWTVNILQETAESRVHEQDWVLRAGGLRDWNATFEGNVAEAVVDKQFLVNATPATLISGTVHLYLAQGPGTTTAFQGEGIITDFSTSAPADGLQTFTATVSGNGGGIKYAPALIAAP